MGIFPQRDSLSAARTRDPSEPEFIGTNQCEKFDKKCDPDTKLCEWLTSVETCKPTSTSSGRNLCYASWMNTTEGGFQFVKKGCWMNEQVCYGKRQCDQRPPVRDIYFCCCEGDFCNRNITFQSGVVSVSDGGDATTLLPPVRKDSESQVMKVILYSIVPIIGAAVIVVVLFFMWKVSLTVSHSVCVCVVLLYVWWWKDQKMPSPLSPPGLIPSQQLLVQKTKQQQKHVSCCVYI